MPDLIRPTSVIAGELTWLQKHERIILVVLVLALGGWLGNKWMNQSAENAKAVLAVQQAASQAAASQAAQAAQTYQVAIDVLSKQVSALDVAMTQRQAVLVRTQTQTATQATAKPDEFVKTWQSLIPGTMGGNIVKQSVTLPDKSTSYQFVVDIGPAIETVNNLESVPVLKANLADETALVNNTQTALNSCTALVDKQKTEIAENTKTCDAKIASLKADARKSKRNWFIAGFISGIATRLLLKF